MADPADHLSKMLGGKVPVDVEIVEDASEDTLPEVAVIFDVGYWAPSSHGFFVVPLRISEQTKERRENDGDPQTPNDALDECGDRVGAFEVIDPVPLLPKTHIIVGHDRLLRKGVSWFQFNI